MGSANKVLWIISFIFMSTLSKAASGPISSGGGNASPTDPLVAKEAIEKFISGTQIMIQEWLRFEEFYYFVGTTGLHPDTNSLSYKLFQGKENVFTILDRLSIRVMHSKPCYNAKGEETDGSVEITRPDEICLSSHRLSLKLTKSQYQPELQALILHEVSHLLGTTESEAYELQRASLVQFQKNQEERVAEDLSKLNYLASFLLTQLDSLKNAKKIQCRPIAFVTQNIAEIGKQVFSEVLTFTFSPLHSDEQDLSRTALVRSSALEDYICGHDTAVSKTERVKFLDRYKRGFGGKSQVGVNTYYSNRFSPPGPKFEIAGQEAVIKLIESSHDVSREMNLLYQEVSVILSSLVNLQNQKYFNVKIE